VQAAVPTLLRQPHLKLDFGSGTGVATPRTRQKGGRSLYVRPARPTAVSSLNTPPATAWAPEIFASGSSIPASFPQSAPFAAVAASRHTRYMAAEHRFGVAIGPSLKVTSPGAKKRFALYSIKIQNGYEGNGVTEAQVSDSRYADGLIRADPREVGVDAAAVEAFLDDAAASGLEIHGLMLHRAGRVVAEGWWWPYRAERPRIMHSATKSVTASAIGMALDEGRFKLQDKVVAFFPRTCRQ